MSSCAVVPIESITAAGMFCASATRVPETPWLLRQFQVVFTIPKLLKFINRHLSNERLSRLSRENATDLYRILQPAHNELVRMVGSFDRVSYLKRILMHSWLMDTRDEVERLGDVVEALAWSSDAELSCYIDSTIGDLERILKA